MKPFIYACMILFVLMSDQAKSNNDSHSDTEDLKVEETLKSFFNGISNYDYEGIREVTSDDFVLVENGPVWDTDKFISFIQRFENDASLSYEFSEMQTTVRGSTAWMVYKNNGTMHRGGQERHFEWTESAVFSKESDRWKIELLHSTMIEPDSTQS